MTYCPEDIVRDTVDVDLNTEFVNNGSLHITWDTPTATATSSITVDELHPSLVSDPHDNQFLPGSTLVSYEFQGNSSQVGVCSFYVNISLGKSSLFVVYISFNIS